MIFFRNGNRNVIMELENLTQTNIYLKNKQPKFIPCEISKTNNQKYNSIKVLSA